MELLYLWIEDFRNIKKQGFDFSAEFKFKMEELSEDLSIPLKESLDGLECAD